MSYLHWPCHHRLQQCISATDVLSHLLRLTGHHLLNDEVSVTPFPSLIEGLHHHTLELVVHFTLLIALFITVLHHSLHYGCAVVLLVGREYHTSDLLTYSIDGVQTLSGQVMKDQEILSGVHRLRTESHVWERVRAVNVKSTQIRHLIGLRLC